MTFKGIDLSPLISALFSQVIVPVLGIAGLWLSAKAAAYFGAKTNKTKAETAAEKVELLIESIVKRAWDGLGPDLQAALADGRISLEERKGLEAKLHALLVDITSQDDLEALAKALGLPMSGLISWIGEKVIRIWISAHDPDSTDSAAAFKLSADQLPAA